MWSIEHRGAASVLSAQQRVLFPVEAGAPDATTRQLTRALLTGSCAGVALLAPDDEPACSVVRTALHDACARNPLLSRAHVAVVVETLATDWTAGTLGSRVESLLERLQLESVDLLLLRLQESHALASKPDDIYETKRAVVRLWTAALELQRSGRVEHLGVSDFSIQQTEFLLSAYPHDPPVAFSLALSFEPNDTSDELRLASVVAYAHGRDIDVIVRFPVRALTSLSAALQDRWSRLVHTIAHNHREQCFQVAVVHETDHEPPYETVTQTQTMATTPALQSSVQIATRYLLQKGLVVIPTTRSSSASSESEANAPFDDDECHELLDTDAHAFAALAPSYSANKLYSSVLPREDVEAIEHTLPLLVRPTRLRPDT